MGLWQIWEEDGRPAKVLFLILVFSSLIYSVIAFQAIFLSPSSRASLDYIFYKISDLTNTICHNDY